MHHTSLLSVLLAGVLTIAACTVAERPPPPHPQPEPAISLHAALAGATAPRIVADAIHDWDNVQRFYRQRAGQPAWLDGTQPSAAAGDAVRVLRTADREGLDPAAYHVATLGRQTCQHDADMQPCVAFELLLTDALLRYAHDVQHGRIDPQQADPEWFIATPPAPDDATALQDALSRHQLSMWLAQLPPPAAQYAQLRDTLAHYRALADAGGWPPPGDGPKLAPGANDAAVQALRQRLLADGDGDLAAQDGAADTRFDAALEQAVRRFQQRHGLTVDGTVGARTRAALNVSAQTRVRQLQDNMERWRWLVRELPRQYVWINVPGFDLEVVEDGRVILAMPIIVGRDLRHTPAFTSRLTQLIFNPYWNVPHSIATKDLLPKLRSNPGFLHEQQFEVFTGWDAGVQPVDPQSIDWSRYSTGHFPFRLRQMPGPHNALGRVKFLLPNPYDIYLHDTPGRNLFNKPVRTFSSGCIRLAAPLELADYVLRSNPHWSRERIDAAIATGTTRTVRVTEPLPVYLVYFTAWVDAQGAVQFRDDIYNRDARLEQMLGNVH